MEKKYKVHEVVWAKVRGFPWWPGRIGKQLADDNNEQKYVVDFIGDVTHADLPHSKIEKFESKYEEFSKTKKKNLIKSIELANKIIKGEVSFEIHHSNLIKLKKKVKKHESSEGEAGSDSLDCSSGEEESWKKEKEPNASITNSKRDRSKRSSKNLKEYSSEDDDSEEESSENEKNDKNEKSDKKLEKNINSNSSINKKGGLVTKNWKGSSTKEFASIESFKYEKEKLEKINNLTINTINNNPLMTFQSVNPNSSQSNKEPNSNKESKEQNYNNNITPTNSNNNIRGEKQNKNQYYCQFIEEIRENIKSLIMEKLILPSSSTNKNILSKLEFIQGKLNLIKKEDFFDLACKEFLPTLSFFLTYKNQQIAIKSSELLETIKDKIISELFDYTSNKQFEACSIKHKYSNSPNFNIQILSEKIMKDLNEETAKANNFIKNKEMTKALVPKKSNIRVIDDIIIGANNNHSSYLFNEKFSKENSHSNNEKHHSHNNYKEDKFEKEGKDIKADKLRLEKINSNVSKKQQSDKMNKEVKIRMNGNIKMNIDRVFVILSESLNLKENIFKNEKEFIDCLSDNINEISNNSLKTKKPPTNKFMTRKKICIKLMKFLTIMLRKHTFEPHIKKIVLFIEQKVRDKDPTVSEGYIEIIKSLFNKIKEEVTLNNVLK